MSRPHPLELRLDDVVVRAGAAALASVVAERVRACGADTVVADVGALTADCRTLDALARIQLAVRRVGAALVLDRATPDLAALLDLAGLCDVLPAGRRDARPDLVCSDVEVVGQPELGEQRRSDEVRDARDPAVTDLEDVDGPRLEATGDRRGLVLREGG